VYVSPDYYVYSFLLLYFWYIAGYGLLWYMVHFLFFSLVGVDLYSWYFCKYLFQQHVCQYSYVIGLCGIFVL
jgi:hypothetical protein